MSLNKFLNIDELKAALAVERANNKTIAFANGGFDLIHIGHVRYLKGAGDVADILVLALNSDSSLKKIKGDKRAILDEKSRVRILASFECIDYITLFDETTVDNLLLTLLPDFHCKGSDYTVDTVPERETVKSYGGKIAIVGGDKIRNTSDIIENIKKK